MTVALLTITDREARYWRTVMADHADREWYGCRLCRVRGCGRHAEARAALAMAGRIDWDPLRVRAQEDSPAGILRKGQPG